MPIYQAPPLAETTVPRKLFATITSVCACFVIVCHAQNASQSKCKLVKTSTQTKPLGLR